MAMPDVKSRPELHLLTRPVGRPPKRPERFYHSIDYQAKSWDHARRVVAKTLPRS